MEWLFSHPEDLSIAPPPAAAAPEQATGEAQQLKLSPAQVGHFIKLFRNAQAATNLASLVGQIVTFPSCLGQAINSQSPGAGRFARCSWQAET